MHMLTAIKDNGPILTKSKTTEEGSEHVNQGNAH